MNRLTRLFGRRDKLSEHSVVANVEHAIFSDVRKRATRLQEAIDTPPTLPNGERLDPKVWSRLAEDTFAEYAGMDEPTIRSRDKLDPRFHVNRELSAKLSHDESFGEQHAMTRGETLESTIATLGALGSLRKSYGDELGEAGERENEIAQAEDKLEAIDQMLAELRQQRNELHGDPDEIDPQIRDLAKQKRATVSVVQEAVAHQAQHAGDIIDAARVAASKAADAAEEAVECMSLLPGKQAGPGRRVSPDLMLGLADRVQGSHTLRKILDMLGRMEVSMGNTRRQMRRGGFEELVDLELGNDLLAVLPQERALMMHPTGKLDFYRRYHERALMQYEFHSEIELKHGPLIFGADGSDSMRGARNEFCRGLTIASCSIANREHRDAMAIEFASAGELREIVFPRDQPLDPTTVLDFAEHFYAGGTNINQVLRRAREIMLESAPFHNADLVLVTDGGDVLTEESIALRDELRAMGVRIHGLVIESRPTEYMITVCDTVSSVFDFTGPNSTSDRIAIDLT